MLMYYICQLLPTGAQLFPLDLYLLLQWLQCDFSEMSKIPGKLFELDWASVHMCRFSLWQSEHIIQASEFYCLQTRRAHTLFAQPPLFIIRLQSHSWAKTQMKALIWAQKTGEITPGKLRIPLTSTCKYMWTDTMGLCFQFENHLRLVSASVNQSVPLSWTFSLKKDSLICFDFFCNEM